MDSTWYSFVFELLLFLWLLYNTREGNLHHQITAAAMFVVFSLK